MGLGGYKIGNTSFHESIDLSNRMTLNGTRPVVFVKREDENYGNSFKSREIEAELKRYKHVKGPVVFFAITDGYRGRIGAELCHAYGKGRKFASIVDISTDPAIKRRLRKAGSYVIETDLREKLSVEEARDMVIRKVGKRSGVIPVSNIDADGSSYKAISRELSDVGVDRTWRVYVPLGGGNLAANLYWGFEEIDREKPGSIPVIVGGTIPDNIFGEKIEDVPSPAINLVAPHSQLEIPVQQLIDDGKIIRITCPAKKIWDEIEELRKIKMKSCNTSAAAFAAARIDAEQGKIAHGQRIAIINTGYEPETTRWGSAKEVAPTYARNAALTAAGLLMLFSPGDLRTDYAKTNPKIVEGWHREYLEGERDKLARVPELADMEAYAKYRGHIEKLKDGTLVMLPNKQVLNNLTFWNFAQDMITRDMYNKNISGMKDDVNGFDDWKRKRQEAKGAGKDYWVVSK